MLGARTTLIDKDPNDNTEVRFKSLCRQENLPLTAKAENQDSAGRILPLPRHQVSYQVFPYQPNSAALKSLLIFQMATKRSTAKRSVGGYNSAIRAQIVALRAYGILAAEIRKII